MKKTCLLVTFLFFCGVIFSLTACQPQASSLQTVEVVEEFPANSDFQAFTVSQISDYPLYEFHYPGDYGFDEYLRTGTSAWEPEIRISSPYCFIRSDYLKSCIMEV